jgi:2-deoxy-D-gluconate 3-dehydrogenase
MINLNGKTVLVAGGMHRLAGAVAQPLNAAGANIIFAHRPDDEAQAKSLANAITSPQHLVRTQPISFLDADALKAEIIALGVIDIVLIAPAWMAWGPFLDTTPADWDAVLACNFEQATYIAQAAAHHLVAQGRGGRIIFLSSVASLMPVMHRSAVGTSLAALSAIAKMAAVDLAPYGITVNTVAVGWVEAAWTEQFLTPEGRKYVEKGIPAGRIATPEEVGDVCSFLASDLSGYVTGAVIPVDGGYMLTRAEQPGLPYPQPR